MRTTVTTLPNESSKNLRKENPLKKKALNISLFLIIILFLIFIGVSI